MREFVKDYVQLCKDSGNFCKKHWKGVVAVNAVIIGAEIVYYKIATKKINKHIKDVAEKVETQ